MLARHKAYILLGLYLISVVCGEEDEIEGEDHNPFSCRVESCAGWRLNKLPEVKRFIHEDLETLFLNTEFKKIPGKSPEMIFYNKNGEELERMDISQMLQSELVALLDKKGIARRKPKDKTFKGEL